VRGAHSPLRPGALHRIPPTSSPRQTCLRPLALAAVIFLRSRITEYVLQHCYHISLLSSTPGATNRAGRETKGQKETPKKSLRKGERFSRAPLLFTPRFHRDWQAACRSLLSHCSSLRSSEVLSRRHGYRIRGLALVWFCIPPCPCPSRSSIP
jgi:hypothetical protein